MLMDEKKKNNEENPIYTDKPVLLSELPPMKIDYKAMTEYARSKGTRPSRLTEQEKNLFITKYPAL